MPSDLLTVLKLVAKTLDGAGVAYMVSGSMAMNYYAQPRMTRDIPRLALRGTLGRGARDRRAAP
jgi:hypothetical protein